MMKKKSSMTTNLNTTKTIDLLIASLPPNYLDEPSIAPALLKSVVEANGFSCHTVDFSLHLLQTVFNNDYQSYLDWGNCLMDNYNFSLVTQQQLDLIDISTNQFISLIQQHRPVFVGISVFSIWQQRLAYFVCKKIKQMCPEVKVIIGGMGCSQSPSGLKNIINLGQLDFQNNFGMLLSRKQLVDYVVINDGEVELVNILKGNFQQTFDPKEVTFEQSVCPNFDNYDLDSYFYVNNEKKLLVQGSKGCVRQCVFCSEHSNYSTFYYKSGTAIAEQLIELSQRYDIYKFQFTDSLINGSLREFKKMLVRLAEYNQSNPGKEIRWHGNYICRYRNNMTDNDYRLIKQSGGHGLTIGVESGSNSVLAEMRKQMTVEDIEYEISKFDQHGIDCTLLLMVGFYFEMWRDFLDTLRMLKRLHRYFLSGTITAVRFGYGLSIDKNSPIWNTANPQDFKHDITNSYNWLYLQNPTLTLKERIRRRIIAQEFCDALSIPVAYAREDLLVLDAIYNNNLELVTINDHN